VVFAVCINLFYGSHSLLAMTWWKSSQIIGRKHSCDHPQHQPINTSLYDEHS